MLVEEAVEVKLGRALRVELKLARGVSVSRALRVPVRVEVGEAVGSAPITASSRGKVGLPIAFISSSPTS